MRSHPEDPYNTTEESSGSIDTALRMVSGSDPLKLLNLDDFILELDGDSAIKNLPIYQVFKMGNTRVKDANSEELDKIIAGIEGELYTIKTEKPSCIENIEKNSGEYEKRVAAQKGILILFLFRLAILGLYQPDNTYTTGPLKAVIGFITP